MKITKILTAFIFVNHLISSPSLAAQKFEALKECQGEGCDCTREKTADKDFSLYAQMDTSSKKLGDFKSGMGAKLVSPYTKIIIAGKSKILKIIKPIKGLKKGDEVTHILSEGEGFGKAKKKGQWIHFEFENIEFKEIIKPQFEAWYEVEVGKTKGYTQVFPFLGCLE